MTDICTKDDCELVLFCGKTSSNGNAPDDDSIFQVLYKLYKQPIYAFFYKKLNNDYSAAEDLTQETFTKVYQNVAKVNDFCGIKSWIYAIANNTYIDYWRKHQKNFSRDVPLELDSAAMPTDNNSPLHDLLDSEINLDLNEIYQALPPKYLQAIFLHEQNYSYGQAAKVMDISLSAYTSLLNRARLKTKEVMIYNLFRVSKDTLTKKEYDTLSQWLGPIQLFYGVTGPIKQGMLEHFNTSADSYNELNFHHYHSLIDDFIIRKYPLNKKHVVADFGMGTGIFASKLSRYVARVDGYDFSKEMCDLAEKTFRDNQVDNVVCKNVDFLKRNASADKYDYAYCMTVLHHLTYPHNAVKKMVRMLKDGGGLIISDFAKHNCAELVEVRSDLWYGFTKEQFTKYLTDAGLKNVWVEIHKKAPITFISESGKTIKIPTIIGGGEK
ncbi:RNA polymerase sigma factor, sigma-70 family [Desulfitobacterium dichloroeliminans LMG P-21439]|uniref:RNA polymerase sigma factor, sigma-70 family n=1 Tax=Desulfitobacterium dichloroeliminans (strain LMG P-21439 / DCA1) TaxID=871963 RepID=L0F5P5_DESDL|nr:sigma-70 family RNA polymerase sigma factor [Desulfitobacterium dichloroeliminans]AGA68278.1 RNA polymerase sigma factor, sigma-70 family [Desulfitobacterium dichloroeliminans LMG P-21439]